MANKVLSVNIYDAPVRLYYSVSMLSSVFVLLFCITEKATGAWSGTNKQTDIPIDLLIY